MEGLGPDRIEHQIETIVGNVSQHVRLGGRRPGPRKRGGTGRIAILDHQDLGAGVGDIAPGETMGEGDREHAVAAFMSPSQSS